MKKASVGGILAIVSGALGILVGLGYLAYPLLMSSVLNSSEASSAFSDIYTYDQFVSLMWGIFIVVFVLCLIIGVLSILGGVFALRRRHFAWALTGAIASSLAFYPLGIVAVVLVSMDHTAFQQAPAPALIPPPPPPPVPTAAP